MADPAHEEPLDAHDRLTVRLYRAGIGLAAIGVGAMAYAHATGAADGTGRLVVLAGVACIAADLHLYVKRIRWVIGAAGWVGAVGTFAATRLPPPGDGWVADAALGFLFVTLSGVALKERFCFRLPVVVLVPVLLAASLVPLRTGFDPGAAALLGLGATVLALLALAKARMPLHYDIGDKRRYEV